MREITIRLKFVAPCLGNRKMADGSGRFVFQRNPSTNRVLFLPTWHYANMRFAAQLLNRHQDQVGKINWDPQVDGRMRSDNRWFRREYTNSTGTKHRHALHEAFFPEQEISINACLPATISEDDFISLMAKAGQYRGLSPWKPGEYGFYSVVSIRRRAAHYEAADRENSIERDTEFQNS